MDRKSWPEPWDEGGWREAIAGGLLKGCPPEAVVAAVRALHLSGDPDLIGSLTRHVSDLITRRLRYMIGTDHANRGDDIVERAHGALLLAIFDPSSDDGAALTKAFWVRVKFRAIDAVRVEVLHRRRHRELPLDDDGELAIDSPSRPDPTISTIDVAQHLACIPDPRKRLAFHLFLQGMQIRKGDPCISSVLGCDPKTARKWIEQARQILQDAGYRGHFG